MKLLSKLQVFIAIPFSKRSTFPWAPQEKKSIHSSACVNWKLHDFGLSVLPLWVLSLSLWLVVRYSLLFTPYLLWRRRWRRRHLTALLEIDEWNKNGKKMRKKIKVKITTILISLLFHYFMFKFVSYLFLPLSSFEIASICLDSLNSSCMNLHFLR